MLSRWLNRAPRFSMSNGFFIKNRHMIYLSLYILLFVILINCIFVRSSQFLYRFEIKRFDFGMQLVKRSDFIKCVGAKSRVLNFSYSSTVFVEIPFLIRIIFNFCIFLQFGKSQYLIIYIIT